MISGKNKFREKKKIKYCGPLLRAILNYYLDIPINSFYLVFYRLSENLTELSISMVSFCIAPPFLSLRIHLWPIFMINLLSFENNAMFVRV